MSRYTLFISTPKAPEDFEEVAEGNQLGVFLERSKTYEECGYYCVIWSHTIDDSVYETRELKHQTVKGSH